MTKRLQGQGLYGRDGGDGINDTLGAGLCRRASPSAPVPMWAIQSADVTLMNGSAYGPCTPST